MDGKVLGTAFILKAVPGSAQAYLQGALKPLNDMIFGVFFKFFVFI